VVLYIFQLALLGRTIIKEYVKTVTEKKQLMIGEITMEYVKIEADRLKRLLKANRKLRILENNGVDNWEGYGEGFEELENSYERIDKEVDEMERV
jgi:hypothetical protein